MSFDVSSVDLSLVEPALRADVLRRIQVIEEFSRTRGLAARLSARAALGLNDHQINTLAKAWRSRHRAEDVTLRSTRRSYPTPLVPELIAIIDDMTDANPGATIVVIHGLVAARAKEVSLPVPTYPTVNKYVRKRMAATRKTTLAAMGHDVLIDVTIVDIPVGEAGRAVRPFVVAVVDAASAQLAGLSGTLHPVDAATVAQAIRSVIESDLQLLEGDPQPTPLRVSMPAASEPGWNRLMVAMRDAGCDVTPYEIRPHLCGRPAAALFGTTWGGYKLRPRLIGRSDKARITSDERRMARSLGEALDYLGAVARDGAIPSLSPFARLGRTSLEKLSGALSALCGPSD